MTTENKKQPNVLEVLPEKAAQPLLSLEQVKEALRRGSKERQQAEARVPHSTSSSRNRYR
jgi:hypothetical protein